MFAAERWAEAFAEVLLEKEEEKENLNEGLTALRILFAFLEKLEKNGRVAGIDAANRLERLFACAGFSAGGFACVCACRFTALLVARGRFSPRNGAAILDAVEGLRDKQRGVIAVTVDAAAPAEEGFLAELRESLKTKLGGAEITLLPRIVPELLGGYRLHIGSELVDASLRTLLRSMAVQLHAAPAATGGSVW